MIIASILVKTAIMILIYNNHSMSAYIIFRGIHMKKLKSCEFNLDTAYVELLYTDGTTISIDTIAVENEYAEDMYQRSELDWLIYNDPLSYADLVLNGDIEEYLNWVTQYRTTEE